MNNAAKSLKKKGALVTFSAIMEAAKEKWHVSGKGACMKKEKPPVTLPLSWACKTDPHRSLRLVENGAEPTQSRPSCTQARARVCFKCCVSLRV